MTLTRRLPALLFLVVVLNVSLTAQQSFHVGDRVNAGFMGSSYTYKDGTVIAVAKGKYRVHFDGYADSYDDWVPAARVKPLAVTPAAQNPAAGASAAQAFRVGDRVNAGFMGSSYSYKDGTVIAVANGKYRVHFDGYADSYDDWVPAERVKALVAQPATQNRTATATPAAAANAPAGKQPTCAVGVRVPRAGMLNREARITAVDQRQGLYKVKYDNGDLDEWLPARLLHGCEGSGPAAITEQYFVGKWSLFVGPTPHYEDRGSDRYLVVGPGGKAPPLVVNGDGTYVWTIDSRTVVRGRWRTMRNDEFSGSMRAPGIVLEKGEDGKDWGVYRPDSVGVADPSDRIAIKRLDMGLSYQGTRIR